MDDRTGVYKLTHKQTGRVYVGSAVNLRRRKKDHTSRLNCGRHGNSYLQRAWAKYGPDAFDWTVLEHCEPEDRLVREQHWIDALNATDETCGFNLIPTRQAQNYGAAVTKLQLRRWSKFGKDERKKMCAHLMEPTIRAGAQRKATEAKQTEAYSELRREIAKKGLTTPQNKAGNSARLKAKWQDPEFRAARLAGLAVGRAKTNAKRRKLVHDEIV